MSNESIIRQQPVVRGSISIRRFRQGDTLTSLLKSTVPLVQYAYEGTDKIFPDWTIKIDGQYTEESPIVYPSIQSNLSSLPLTGDDIVNPKWFYDQIEITEDNPSFEIIPSYTGMKLPALRIIGNLMANVESNKTIRLECNAITGGVSTPVIMTIDVQRQVITDVAYKGSITAKNGGVITKDNPEEQLTAVLRKGGKVIKDSDFYIEWWRVVSYDQINPGHVEGDKDPVTGDIIDGVDDGLRRLDKEGNPITLVADDIYLSDTIMAKFFLVENNTQVDYATIGILDLTDPLVIKFTHNPSTAIVEKTRSDIDTGVEVLGYVRTTPRVCEINSDLPFKVGGKIAFQHFSFSLRNNAIQIRTQDYDNILGESGTSIQYFDTKYDDFYEKTVNVDTGQVELDETDNLVLAVESQEQWTRDKT